MGDDLVVVIGDYEYDGKGVFRRVVRAVSPSETYNTDCPILKTKQDEANWVNWKIEDKFWEKVW